MVTYLPYSDNSIKNTVLRPNWQYKAVRGCERSFRIFWEFKAQCASLNLARDSFGPVVYRQRSLLQIGRLKVRTRAAVNFFALFFFYSLVVLHNINHLLSGEACTLISENQCLEKSRSISNPRKFSGSANPDYCIIPAFFQGGDLKKIQGLQNLKFF